MYCNVTLTAEQSSKYASLLTKEGIWNQTIVCLGIVRGVKVRVLEENKPILRKHLNKVLKIKK